MALKKKTAATNPTTLTKKASSTRKPKTRRSRTKYPALNPGLNLKTRTDLIDYDYVDKLSPSEKKWLNKFTEEYVGASLDTENPKKNLHNTKSLKKDCYDRNNARNRCILTLQKAQSKIEYTEENKKVLGENPEEILNRELDIQTRSYYDDYNELSEVPSGKTSKQRKQKKQ